MREAAMMGRSRNKKRNGGLASLNTNNENKVYLVVQQIESAAMHTHARCICHAVAQTPPTAAHISYF
jgi:hypothetical protein